MHARYAFELCFIWRDVNLPERERKSKLRKEGREVHSCIRLREGPIGVMVTLGLPTIGISL